MAYTIPQAARLLIEPGQTEEQVRNRLNHLERTQLLHSFGRRGPGATSPRLYSVPELCKAKVLFALMDMGIAGTADVLRTADTGLIAFQAPPGTSDADLNAAMPEIARRPPPIERALAGIQKGGDPEFVLTFYRNDQNGSIVPRAEVRVYDNDFLVPPSKDFIPYGWFVMQLRPLLLPVLTRLEGPKGN